MKKNKKPLLETFKKIGGYRLNEDNPLEDDALFDMNNELEDMVADMDKQEYGNFIRMNIDSEAERPWATYNDEVKEFLYDLGDNKAAMMQQIKAIKTGQYRL
jgi:hypothetical protein